MQIARENCRSDAPCRDSIGFLTFLLQRVTSHVYSINYRLTIDSGIRSFSKDAFLRKVASFAILLKAIGKVSGNAS